MATKESSEPPSRLPASEAISWPQAFAILNEHLDTSPEEVALWVSQGQLHACSPVLRNGCHHEAVVPFFDEPNTTPAHDLLAGFRFEKRQIQNFVPSAFMSGAGAVASFSVVAMENIAMGTSYYNPSGRFLSFIDAVKFLLALKPLAPKNPEEIESRIARELELGHIAPRHPFGHLLSERRSLSTAWFTEGAILMLAKEYWGAEFSDWDAITRERAVGAIPYEVGNAIAGLTRLRACVRHGPDEGVRVFGGEYTAKGFAAEAGQKTKRDSAANARNAKSASVESRNADMKVFAGKLYTGGKKRDTPWAIRNEALPFPKSIFLDEFWKRHHKYRRVKPSSINFSKIGIRFARGAHSKSSDFAKRIQALIAAAAQE